MNRNYFIAGIVIVIGSVLFFVAPLLKPKVSVPIESVRNDSNSDGSLVTYSAKEPPKIGGLGVTNDPLSSAYQMASFIDQVYDKVPSERETTRLQLKGLQVAFFLSDYVMAAKTNRNLVLSKNAIVNSFTNVSPETSIISGRLTTYAERLGTLSDHYKNVSENYEAKDQIRQIKATVTGNGIVVDTESDLLMDCIRYAFFITDIREMYGPNPSRLEDPAGSPAEFNALINASDEVFAYRLTHKFGLDPQLVINLMRQLKEIRLSGLSDADMQIPARLR